MKLYSENKDYKLYEGSMLDMLEVIEFDSIDSVICDPPYELNFMGKGWDNSGIAFQPDTWKKCYEVLKPGGYLLAFGGSRTFHRIACAIEDAGFEIRDTIMWLYGSGFPKSMDISKQIDKRNKNTKKEYIRFGNYLKLKREEKGINKTQLGKLFYNFKRSEDTPIRSFEKGINLPPKEVYLKLKKILGLNNDFDWLIEREEAEREVIGTKQSGCFNNQEKDRYTIGSSKSLEVDITIPSTDLAKQWQGWGTALKPSFEPIIVARKPFKGSLVDNVIEYGVGGINIDECRVGNEVIKGGTMPDFRDIGQKSKETIGIDKLSFGQVENAKRKPLDDHIGRFPANTILTYDETDFEEVCGGFPNTKTGNIKPHKNKSNGVCNFNTQNETTNYFNGDSGSASRYFYCAKASKKDRDEGLDTFIEEKVNDGRQTPIDNPFQRGETPRRNVHPCVKPTNLMQYLVRLVTPNNGTILDPFNGSGSTGKAVMYENRERNKNYKYIGIELTEEYLPIAKARIEYVCNLKPEVNPQMSIFDLVSEDE